MANVILYKSICIGKRNNQKLPNANLGFCKYILHAIDWAIRDPTAFEER
jgi:hypothetical protein